MECCLQEGWKNYDVEELHITQIFHCTGWDYFGQHLDIYLEHLDRAREDTGPIGSEIGG